MRMFVAITPPEDALEDLAEFLAPRQDSAPGFRWSAQEEWHVTMAFMPQVVERHLDDLWHERHRHVPLLLCGPAESGSGVLSRGQELGKVLKRVLGRRDCDEHPHARHGSPGAHPPHLSVRPSPSRVRFRHSSGTCYFRLAVRHRLLSSASRGKSFLLVKATICCLL